MKHQQGNVLFLILIAVALFAALSYAVTNSSRSGENGISDDKATLISSQMLQYGAQIEQTISRLKLINKCDETEISFERAPFDGSDTDYVNPFSPNDFSCHVFHPAGGNAYYKILDPKWLTGSDTSDWSGEINFHGNDCIPGVGLGNGALCWKVENDGSDDLELNMVITDLNENICTAINKQLHYTLGQHGPSNGDFYDRTGAAAKFKGVFGRATGNGGHIVGNTRSKLSLCYEDLATGYYNFYYVLIAR